MAEFQELVWIPGGCQWKPIDKRPGCCVDSHFLHTEALQPTDHASVYNRFASMANTACRTIMQIENGVATLWETNRD